MSEQPTLRARLAEARENHERLVEQETLALQRLAIPRHANGDRDDDTQQRLLPARQAKLQELRSQRAAFETVVARLDGMRRQMSRDERHLRLQRELFQFQRRRSISSKRLEIEAFLQYPARFLVIQAARESGKSTRVPQYVATELRGRVLCPQPTQKGAREAAKRVAYELSAGDSSSYKNRLYSDMRVESSEGVEVEFLTNCELFELFNHARVTPETENPLEEVCGVVVDGVTAEDEELLELLREDCDKWQHAKIIMMVSDGVSSASVAMTLDDAQIIEVPAVEFPVTIAYDPPPSHQSRDTTQTSLTVALCALRLHESHSRSDGDILCFLRSRHDTLQAKSHFEDALAQAKAWARQKPKRLRSVRTRVLCGYEEPETLEWMDDHDTKRRRNVIFASGDIDSWVSFNDVGIVVDSGLCYGVRTHKRGALPTLEAISTTHSEAQSRAQIAGGSRPGLCVRLYADDANRSDVETNEDVDTPWEEALKDSKLARMVSFAAEQGHVRAGIDLAVMILIASRFFDVAGVGKKAQKKSKAEEMESCGDGDVVVMYHLFHAWKKTLSDYEQEPEPESELASEQWCSSRRINANTMRLALHFSGKLYAIAIRDDELESEDDTSGAIDSTSLRRIIAAGFYENAAVTKSSRQSHTQEYFSLQSKTVGSLASSRFGATLKRSATEGDAVDLDWVVYCGEIRGADGTLCFSLVTPVEEAWILEESPELAENRLDLPVSSYTCHGLSEELIAEVFGVDGKERDKKLALLEQDLACKLVVDAASRTVSAVELAERRIPEVQADLDFHLENGREKLMNQAIERSYMGSTRAVLTSGFHVDELLFQDEFVSLTIQTWPHGVDSLREIVISHCDADITAEIKAMGSDTVILRAKSKHLARKLFESLVKSDTMEGAEVLPLRSAANATPHSHRIMASEFGGRIKISWASGVSTGRAKLHFADAAAANEFLKGYKSTHELTSVQVSPRGVLPEHKIDDDVQLPDSWLKTHNYTGCRDQDKSQLLPAPLCRKGGRVLFDEAAFEEMEPDEAGQVEFCVEIKNGLPLDVDEEKLKELVQPAQVVDCVVRRRLAVDDSEDTNHQRRVYSLPLVTSLETTEEAEYWEKRKARRVGVVVSFTDVQRLDDVYAKVAKSSLWKDIREENPCGQPIRLTTEYSFRWKLSRELFECFHDAITKILTAARAQGIKCRQSEDEESQIVELRLVSSSQDKLRHVATELETSIEFEDVKGGEFKALFTAPGRLKVDEWLDSQGTGPKTKGLAVRVDCGRGLVVYGERVERQKTIKILRDLASQIQSDVEVLDRVVRLDLRSFTDSNPKPKQSKKLVKQWLLAQVGVQQLFHVRVLGSGGRVALSGSRAQVDALVDKWTNEGRLVHRVDTKTLLPDCGVCTLPVEEPVVQFAVCGHSFCLECIQPGVTASTALPLKCPTYNCGRLLHVNDVAKVITNVDAIVATAVFDYVARNSSECVVCPKPGCNQILSRAKLEFDDEGGQFIYCESCAASYCLACSETTGQATKRHDDTSCEEFQAGGGTATDRHVKFLRDNVLTLRCPHCKAAFLDFSGCTCVECGNATCRQYFCANCVAFSSPDSSTTHRHVSSCPKNPSPGGYFVSEQALAAVHRQTRTSQLREYIQTRITSSRVRRNVLQRLTKDLLDLGIPVPTDLVDETAD